MSHKTLSTIIILALLTGCTNNKETGGTLLGGATGALLGSQFGKGNGRIAAVAIGTLAGAFIGNSIGKSMDAQDKQLAARTVNHSLEYAPDYQTQHWHNPNNNHQGKFTVTKTQEYPDTNLVCRDFVHTVILDGGEERVHGRACRDMRDTQGQWEVQK